MKKVISSLLAVVLIVSCVSINLGTVYGESSDAVSADPQDNMITIFDSNAYYSSSNVNPNIDITETDKGLWLQNSEFNTSKPNKDMLSISSWQVSNKILERNKALTSDITDFEWNFDYLGNGSNTRSAFVFHVNEKSDMSSFWNRHNAFSFMLWGSDFSYAGTKNKDPMENAMPHSIALQIPVYSKDLGTNGKSRPFGPYSNDPTTGMRKYDGDTGYLPLGDIDLKKWMKVSIKMVGRTITLTVTQGDITLTKDFVVSQNVLNNAPSGDVAIIQGGNLSYYKNMNVSIPRTIFNSNNYNSTEQKNPSINGVWLGGDSWVSDNPSLKDSVYMGKNVESAKILERNTNFDSVTDFEWQTQFIAEALGAKDMKTSFVFHINENSNINSFSERKNVLAVTYYGENTDMTKHCAVQNAFSIERGVENKNSQLGYMRPYDYDTTVTPWKIKDNSYKKLDDASAAKSIDITKYVTLNIKLEGSNLKVSFWQTADKENTYREFSVIMYTSAMNLSPSGDFAIISRHEEGIQHNINYRIKDMTVRALDFKDIDVPKPQEPIDDGTGDVEKLPENGIFFENDFEKNQDGVVVSTTPKEPEKTGIFEDKNGNKYLQVTHDHSHQNGNDGWNIIKIAPNKKYDNFTLNFKVRLTTELNPMYHSNWHYVLVGFRSQNGVVDSNVLQMSSSGAAFSVAKKSAEKDYTNNRIAYADNDATFGNTFNLPSGCPKAGLSPDGVWHKVSVVADGWTYKYYLDGELMLETKDTQKEYKNGNIVIASRSVNMQLDDVEILSPKAKIEPFEQEQLETGLLYENDFQSKGDNKRLTVVRGQNYGVVTEGKKKYYHIDYEPNASNAANGPVNMTFGPTGIKDFTLNMHVRITNKISPKWHSIILMGRTKSGGISSQARVLNMGSFLSVQSDKDIYEVARSGPAAQNTTSTFPCHDEKYGIPIFEWHKVSLVCEDWKYTLYIDGKKIIEGVDKIKLNKWGGFALRTEGVNLDIDNIRIWGTPHYDLSFTEEVPAGTLYKNNFEKSSLDGISFTYYDEEKTTVMSEENGNKFLRAYPNMRTKEDGTLEVVGNGNLLFSFGPPNAMDFELNFKLRVKSNTHENLGSTIIGIHSKPSNLKWDSVWVNILARGTSVSLKDSARKLGIDNLIATTGKNRSGGTAYMPSDNRAFGVRPDGKWHDIKVVSKGYTYTLYVDGNKYISVTDKDKTFYKGYTVIGSNGCIIDVDDISLTNK